LRWKIVVSRRDILTLKFINDNKVKKYNGEEEDDEIVMLIGQFTKFFRYDKFGGNQRNFRRKKVDKEE
jgi:hypothetical protein